MKLIATLLKNKRLLLISVFLVSILIQVVCLLAFRLIPFAQHQIPPDYTSLYEPVAQNILDGKGIVDAKGNLAIVTPPGYPIILSMIFGLADFIGASRLGLITVFNLIIVAITCLFVFFMTELIFSRRIALVASLIWITYPFNLWFIKQPNSEVPFLLFLYLGILLFILSIKKKNLALPFTAGIIFALAAFVRPISILLGFLCALAFLFFKEIPKMKRVFYAMLLLTGFLITTLPWEIYVLSSTGDFIPLASSGESAIRGGLTYAIEPGVGGDQPYVPEDVMALMKRIRANPNLNTLGSIFNYLVQELTNKPVPILKLIGLKLCRSWYGTFAMWHEGKILAIQVLYLAMGIIGIIFGIRIYRNRLQYIIFLLATVFYFWGMNVLVNSKLRYMIPAMVFIIIFSAIPIDRIIFRRPRKK